MNTGIRTGINELFLDTISRNTLGNRWDTHINHIKFKRAKQTANSHPYRGVSDSCINSRRSFFKQLYTVQVQTTTLKWFPFSMALRKNDVHRNYPPELVSQSKQLQFSNLSWKEFDHCSGIGTKTLQFAQ